MESEYLSCTRASHTKLHDQLWHSLVSFHHLHRVADALGAYAGPAVLEHCSADHLLHRIPSRPRATMLADLQTLDRVLEDLHRRYEQNMVCCYHLTKSVKA